MAVVDHASTSLPDELLTSHTFILTLCKPSLTNYDIVRVITCLNEIKRVESSSLTIFLCEHACICLRTANPTYFMIFHVTLCLKIIFIVFVWVYCWEVLRRSNDFHNRRYNTSPLPFGHGFNSMEDMTVEMTIAASLPRATIALYPQSGFCQWNLSKSSFHLLTQN